MVNDDVDDRINEDGVFEYMEADCPEINVIEKTDVVDNISSDDEYFSDSDDDSAYNTTDVDSDLEILGMGMDMVKKVADEGRHMRRMARGTTNNR